MTVSAGCRWGGAGVVGLRQSRRRRNWWRKSCEERLRMVLEELTPLARNVREEPNADLFDVRPRLASGRAVWTLSGVSDRDGSRGH